MSTIGAARPVRRRLGDVLKAKKRVTEADLIRLMDEAPTGERLGDLILERGLVSKEELALALQEVIGCRYVDARFATVEASVLKRITRVKAARYCALPIGMEEKQLIVVMSDPQNLNYLDELRFASGLEISPRLGIRSEILTAIKSCYDEAERQTRDDNPDATATVSRSKLSFIDQVDSSDLQFFSSSTSERNQAALEEFAAEMRNETTPAVKVTSAILRAAVAKKASDVHIEPHEESTLVRIRVDGVLRDLTLVPNELQLALVSRIKILADLDIADRRAPQDGRFMVQCGKRKLDFRVSTLPTHDGEKVVMRLLDAAATRVDFSELGFEDANAKAFRKILAQPQGMILVTGPTGSGKSTTLYSALNTVTTPTANVITVEDPVEFKIREINQVQVNPKAGLTFATCLRSILRQDPNVIMVGEIRDSETAEIALQAAQTGHLVMSSLHTNDSVSAVTRLIDLKVPSYLVASSVSVVIAQRLVRRLCFCKNEAPVRTDYVDKMRAAGIAEIGDKMYVPVGCSACDGTGYKGRVAAYEMLIFDEPIRAAIRAGVSDQDILAIARAGGMRTLQEDAIHKVLQGLTTMEEIARVIGFGDDRSPRCRCGKVVSSEFQYCPACGTTIRRAAQNQLAAGTGAAGSPHYVV